MCGSVVVKFCEVDQRTLFARILLITRISFHITTTDATQLLARQRLCFAHYHLGRRGSLHR